MLLPRRNIRAAALLASTIALSACSNVVHVPGETAGSGGAAGGGGSSTGGGTGAAPPVCKMDPGGELLPNLAEGDSDFSRPGRPAVAAGADHFLVVSPRIALTYMGSSVVGALVTKDRAVEKNLTIADGLGEPISVDAASDGASYLVAYVAGNVLLGARLAADGTPMGGPITIAPEVSGSALDVDPPALAFGSGKYLIVYERYTDQRHLYARTISPGGDVSGEIVISEAKGGQDAPAVTFDGEHFLVVWQDGRNQVSYDDTDIYAARVAPDGTVLDPSGIAVSTAPGAQITPHAAFDGTRDIVVWFDATDTSLFGEGNVRGARLGTDGSLIDGPPEAGGFTVNDGPDVKDRPRALALGQGTLVVWGTPGFPGNGGAGLFGAHLGADGTPLGATGGEGLALSGPPEDSARFLLPTAAALADRGLVVWLDDVELGGSTKAVRGAALCPF
jgi:hypothetical protein